MDAVHSSAKALSVCSVRCQGVALSFGQPSWISGFCALHFSTLNGKAGMNTLGFFPRRVSLAGRFSTCPPPDQHR